MSKDELDDLEDDIDDDDERAFEMYRLVAALCCTFWLVHLSLSRGVSFPHFLQ